MSNEQLNEREILRIGAIETNEQFSASLGEIMRLLGIASKDLRERTQETIAAEKEYKRIHSTAVLNAGLSKELTNAEARKAKADLIALNEWEAMQVAKFRRENCLEWIDTLKKALVAVQSIGSSLRTEMQMSGIDPSPQKRR